MLETQGDAGVTTLAAPCGPGARHEDVYGDALDGDERPNTSRLSGVIATVNT